MGFWISGARFRKPLLMVVDFGIFSVSYFIAWFALMRRIDFGEYFATMMLGYVFFILIFFVIFWIFGMYESLWRYAEAYEFLKCMVAIVVAVAVFMIVTGLVLNPELMQIVERRLPFTVYFVTSASAGAGSLFFRTAYRAFRASKARRRLGAKSKKVLLVGASETGVAVIHGLERNPSQRYEIVCAVDDSPFMQGRKIGRVPISGSFKDIPRLAARHGVQVILMAVPHAAAKERRRISGICAATGCELKKVPDIFDFRNSDTDEASVISRIEDISVEDLLGRDVVDIKRFKEKYLAGRTVLVTGAGGTIGSELCRQAAAHGAARIVMLDCVENGLFAIEQELIFKFGRGNANGGTIVLAAEVASVREEARLDRLFAKYKPDLVYHAAAHKHVPLMETAPEEAVKNNIFGTLNVAQAAARHGVKRFVLISTDKAVNPTNIYGATKRVCEMIVQGFNGNNCGDFILQEPASHDFLTPVEDKQPKTVAIAGNPSTHNALATEFTAVRFGNVLGSNGSVIPLFKAQIAAGGPVRVTHKDIIRYYMTVSEAVSLVMSAGEMAQGGEIFVLDMGDPVKTLDLAEMMIRLSGQEPHKDIGIEITGLRPGEKLFEELLMAEEGLQKTSNNKIFIGKPIDLQPQEMFAQLDNLKTAAENGTREELAAILHKLVPGFTSTND